MSVLVPILANPPRRIPLGVKLAILDHRFVSGSLYSSLPAAVVLLLSAFGRPVTGMRIALCIVGTIFLLLAMRRAVPRLLLASRTLWRMRSGRVALGKIKSCRFSWPIRGRETPFEQFLREWSARDAHWYANQLAGCILKPLAWFFAVICGTSVAIYIGGALARVLKLPAEVTGDFGFANFLRLCGYIVLVAVMFVLASRIWRFYFMWRFETEYREELALEAEERHERELLLESQDPGARVKMINPLPADETTELACKVEYRGPSGVRIAKAGAYFGPRLGLSGVEPLLFDPSLPDEVDLFIGIPQDVRVTADGHWQAQQWGRHPVSLFAAAAVFVVSLAALGAEIFSLW